MVVDAYAAFTAHVAGGDVFHFFFKSKMIHSIAAAMGYSL